MVSYQKSIVKYGMGIFYNATKSREKFRCFDENRVRPFLLHGTTENGFRYRVAAPSIRFVPWAALASCWPLPQQLLPVSAAGGGRRRCTLRINSGKIILNSAMPDSLRAVRHCIFTGGVITGNGRCHAAFCESAALRLAGSPSPSVRFAHCHLSQRERPWHDGKVCGSSAKFPGVPAPPWGSCRAATEGL